MAIYSCSTTPIKRSNGRSATAAAAYRAGCKLEDRRTGLTHDYTKKDGVVWSFAASPQGELLDREQLWNAAESAEKRKDARTAREWLVALPDELDENDRQALVVDFGKQLMERYGVALDANIHEPSEHGDQRNHHAHILTTTRVMNEDGTLGEKATIELSDTKRAAMGLGKAADEISAVRKVWEDCANRALERAGSHERIDCRSLANQGSEMEPTQHVGHKATSMERKGERTDRGDHNRAVTQRNAVRAQIIDLRAKKAEKAAQRRENPQSDDYLWAKSVVSRWDEAVSARAHEIRSAGVKKWMEGVEKTDRLKEERSAAIQRIKPVKKGIFASLLGGSYKKRNDKRARKLQAIYDHYDPLDKAIGREMQAVRAYREGRDTGGDAAVEQLSKERPIQWAEACEAREVMKVYEERQKAKAQQERQAKREAHQAWLKTPEGKQYQAQQKRRKPRGHSL